MASAGELYLGRASRTERGLQCKMERNGLGFRKYSLRASGRFLEVFTDQPAMQFYSGNFIKNAAYPFKGGYVQTPQILFCLETQFMPDSINKEGFTPCVLRPGEVYDYTTEYRFSAK